MKRQIRATCMIVSFLLFAVGVYAQAKRTDMRTTVETAATRGDAAPTAIASANPEYVIGAEDVLAINVWKEPEISRSLPVRSDGRISLPLVGEIEAAGHTTRYVQEQIKQKLQAYMSSPEVSVMVQEMKSHTFSVLGEVLHPGKVQLNRPTTVLDGIAMAGGFRDFAKRKSIYVLRAEGGSQNRLYFNYNEVIKGKNLQQNVLLQAGDVIVVP